MLEPRDIHWFAGLMEGEGWFGRTNHRVGLLRCAVTSTDKDVIQRVCRLFPVGVYDEKLLPSGKTVYGWNVSREASAAGIMMMLLPLMSERRQARIIACLEAWKSKPIRGTWRKHCRNGHALTPENLINARDGRPRCRTCGRERMRRLRERQRIQHPIH